MGITISFPTFLTSSTKTGFATVVVEALDVAFVPHLTGED